MRLRGVLDMAIPNFIARRATAEDRSVVRELDRASSNEGTLFRGVEQLEATLGSFDARWPDVGPRDDMPFFVVAHDHHIVGFASVDYRAQPKPLLTRIYVTPQARELGAGAALLQHIIDSAKENGETGVDALSLPGDRHTKNLYERQGLKARLIIASSDV